MIPHTPLGLASAWHVDTQVRVATLCARHYICQLHVSRSNTAILQKRFVYIFHHSDYVFSKIRIVAIKLLHVTVTSKAA